VKISTTFGGRSAEESALCEELAQATRVVKVRKRKVFFTERGAWAGRRVLGILAVQGY
jgi:hypothetical protein